MFRIRLKELREKAGYSQYSFADAFGTKQSTVGGWEAGVREPKFETMQKLADFFHVSVDYLLGRDEAQDGPPESTGGVWIPTFGDVAAGIPIEAVENVIGYEEISQAIAESGEHFSLRIRGESMQPRIMDGDVVIVRKQATCDSGDIAVVLVNGDSATVKKVNTTGNGIMLVPINPQYDPKFYTNQDIENLPVQIIGKVVELRGKM